MPRTDFGRRPRLFAAILIVSCVGLACATGYHPVLSAEPNPFAGIRSFAVLPLEYVDIAVDETSERVFLAERQDELEKWTTIKADIKTNYADALAKSLGNAGIRIDPNSEYVLRSHTSHIETGYYRIPAWLAVSRINIHFQITRSDGEVLDEILLYQGVPFDALIAPTVNVRLQRAAVISGRNAARYVENRVK